LGEHLIDGLQAAAIDRLIIEMPPEAWEEPNSYKFRYPAWYLGETPQTSVFALAAHTASLAQTF